MLVKRKSMISGITREKDLDITEAQMADYASGTHMQIAFPNLSPADREFIHTGITDEEWDATFPPEEDDMSFFDDEQLDEEMRHDVDEEALKQPSIPLCRDCGNDMLSCKCGNGYETGLEGYILAEEQEYLEELEPAPEPEYLETNDENHYPIQEP